MTITIAEVLLLAGAAPLAVLYTRIQRQAALAHDTRARLHEWLRAHPGQSRRDMERALGVPAVTLLHHLEVLVELGLVTAHRAGREVLYALPAAAHGPSALRVEARRALARALLDGPRTQAELAAATGLSQRLVAYHLARMEDLVVGNDGRPRRYALRDGPALRDAVMAGSA